MESEVRKVGNIELVIKIPEDEYQSIFLTGKASFRVVNAIETGTILLKGHGRLIDADALLKEHRLFDTYPFPSTTIDNAPTIIEADKAESEVKNEIDN